MGQLCTFVYSHLPGSTRDIDELAAAGEDLAADIGRTMAAIHALPQSLVNNADLPSYTANEFRQRKLNELDQAATTGQDSRHSASPLGTRTGRRWHSGGSVPQWSTGTCTRTTC